jgi:hypothetical protein
MIQKPPNFTGTVDLDGDEPEEHDHAFHEEGEAGHEDGAENTAAAFADEFDRDHDFPEEEADDDLDLDRRKRMGNLITYGGGAVFFLIIVTLGYFQFSPLFAGGKTQQHAHAAVPVPKGPPVSTASMTGGTTALQPNSASNAGVTNAVLPPPPAATSSGGQSPVVNNALNNMAGNQMPQPQPTNTIASNGAAAQLPTAAAPSLPQAQPSSSAAIPYQPIQSQPSQSQPPQTQSVAPAQGSAQGSVQGPTQGPTQGMTPPSSAQPGTQNSNLAAKVDDLATKVSALQTSIATLTAQQNASPQLQQIQNALAALEKQVSALAGTSVSSRATAEAVSPARPLHSTHKSHGIIKRAAVPAAETEDRTAASASRPVLHEAPQHLESGQGGGWILRAATPGSAMIGKPGSNDLQHISVGDTVSGLGRITSISDAGGRWVVKGTSGSIGQ